MSTSTSLLIILYIKVNRDAALRSSKVFHLNCSPRFFVLYSGKPVNRLLNCGDISTKRPQNVL